MIAIVGRACRLPGAGSVEAFWQLLCDGRCAVSRIPDDRWALGRLLHPRPHEKGRSYTWAAGVLDDIWSFEPGMFGLSPREADQMDPQQRLLLELTYEAFEDAGWRPSRLAGSETAVYVGASSTEHGNLRILDPASSDAYTATGNALSIASNRISYAFDLRGPSMTIDTACSSSLVALNEAVGALRDGRIETAVVAGVNILASASAFVSFSQAGMLSRVGLCQAFAAGADGYVRSEGGVVLLLKTLEAARRDGDRVHGLVVGSDVNSDGRTSGIALPARRAQAALIERLYARAGIGPDEVAFVEAHGTGTPVGDPIEAGAIGDAIGRRRSTPVPIGSVKSNIGHTEPAAGLAGVLKAMLALEHDRLPASLHCAEPNPAIPFADLNVAVCAEGLDLPRGRGRRFVGVNSFGFGGTNAHAVLADAPPAPRGEPGRGADALVVSAATRDALAALASSYAGRLAEASPAEAGRLAAAAFHRRDRLSERLVVSIEDRDAAVAALAAAGRGEEDPGVIRGSSVGAAENPVAFVYSGNGSQWVGMGRSAFAANAAFRSRLDEIDRIYRAAHGWSPKDALFDDDLAERLPLTSVAQPLIFALQAASTFALAERGLVPDLVLGHSVGEIAAAEAAGVLDLADAVRVIHHRSHRQEATRHRGAMAVASGTPEQIADLLAAFPAVDVAALNSPRAYTLAGPTHDIEALVAAHGFAPFGARRLDLDYPFHSRLMADVEGPIRRDLAGLAPRAGSRPIVSTVTGAVLDGRAFDAGYWWRNIREPVRFRDAVGAAAAAGARVVVEVGPRPTLLRYIGDSFGEIRHAAFGLHDRKPAPGDPFARAAGLALARGGRVDPAPFGDDPGPAVALPPTPWNRTRHRLARTVEASAMGDPQPPHPLAGARLSGDALVWTSTIDTALLPGYADHRVGAQVLLPGSGFVEMALTAARQWLPDGTPALRGFEIVAPLVLSDAALRDVMIRIASGARVVEILSRRHLTSGAWQLHARAKIVEGAAPEGRFVPETGDEAGPRVGAAALYARAEAAGLHYGPSFRLAIGAERRGAATILVDLDGAPADPAYALDPMRFDACFHGLALVFAGPAGDGAGRPFIPVRFDEVRLVRPGATAARAVISLLRVSERGILADFTVLDADGATVAEIRRARFQPMRLRRSDELARHTVIQRLQPATAPTAMEDGAGPMLRDAVAAALPPGSADDAVLGPSALLLEGWATARAFEIASALAEGDVVDPPALAAAGRVDAARVGWLAHILGSLTASGLATRDGSGWRLVTAAALPPSRDVLRALAAEHPDLSIELPLAAHVDAAGPAATLPAGALDALEMRGAFVREAAAVLDAAVNDALGRAGRSPVIRVLQIGSGPLSRALAPLVGAGRIALTVLEPDRRRFERAKLALQASVVCLATLDDQPEGRFDLVLAADALHRIDPGLVRDAADRLSSGGLMLAVEPAPSLFRDLVCGRRDGWFTASADPMLPSGGIPDGDEWSRLPASLGLAARVSRPVSLAAGAARLLMAEAPARAASTAPAASVLVLGDDGAAADATYLLATSLAARGARSTAVLDLGAAGDAGEAHAAPAAVVVLAGAFTRGGRAAERLAERCLALKRVVAHLASRPTALWVVCPGATRPEIEAVGPVQAGIWAFTRTLANENPWLDVRRVDVPLAFDTAVADRLCHLVLGGTVETEIVLDADRTQVVRIGGPDLGASLDGPPAEAAALDQVTPGVLGGLRWVAARRSRPGSGEVEIAVEATGVNFRDVLFALSMLPDDILDDGFSGPGMGLEVAGRVLRVGTDVTHVAPGDAVVAFARSGFATHVTLPADLVVPSPKGLPAEAAATIPVAFMTAYHGLVTQARLRRRETVLIHGAAGGVGLAAIQVAKRRGARVVATAGTPERRALALAMGADHAFDSRSLAFVDDVRALARDGVDVVLNSLAGEAMEESLGLLKPFGRFVELGKRDYVADTHVGLRPFRRNLSYFGVDLDQLLLGQPSVGRRLLRDVMRLFDRGALIPLLYERFSADEAPDAFRLMQASGHVGKIVVTPPAPGSVAEPRRASFRPDPTRTHVISGAFGGFGAETARWLVDGGARHLLLLGRRGAEDEAARALVAELEAHGATVAAPPCDVADRDALAAALAAPGLPPLGGVVHAAMVLDDGLVSNLDRQQLDRVLAPKVVGADFLDELTRGAALDYFVLFSSATTLIGNPGQGAYVAANAYIEAVARRRRRAGLPGLAVAWGAIEDVGVLTRKAGVKDRLAARVGIDALKARDALDLMAAVLARQGPSAEEAVVGLAAVDWSAVRDRLAVLRSPTYAASGGDGPAEAAGSDVLDLQVLAAAADRDDARRRVASAIADEVARILRLPPADIAQSRALSELGLDSLMGVELAMALQTRFALGAPPADLSSSLSILNLADLLLGGTNAPAEAPDAAVALARRHLDTAAAVEAATQVAGTRQHLTSDIP